MSEADSKQRAEFPPTAYWRRWVADAGQPMLPGAPDEPAATRSPSAGAQPGDAIEVPHRVLVVEDDPSQALFAESVLNGAGLQARVVSVATGFMAALAEFQPDLVLMDLHMPGMDGSELTAQLRGQAAFSHIPVVFLTGDADPERQFEALEVGADDFLTKPVRPRHLIAAVQNRIRRARALQQMPDPGRHAVTGLNSRLQLLQQLADAIPATPRGALGFVEIEGITALRDRYGYACLETILTDAGRHLRTLVGDASATRLNDNTFLVFAPDVARIDLDAWARGLRDGIGSHPFPLADQTIRLRALVGYADLVNGYDEPGSALAAAEQALRESRGTPVGIAVHMPAPRVAPGEAQGGLGDDLRDALDEQRIELAFQPIVAVAGGDEAQYQTLLRLRGRDGELHSAARVLPAAELAGLLLEIDRRVIELALATQVERQRLGSPMRLFVSQSSRSLIQAGYADWLVQQIEAAGVPGASLVIDVRQDDALIHALSLQDFCARMGPAGVQLCLGQYSASEEADALLAQLPLGFVRLAARYSRQLDEPRIRDEMRAAVERAHRLGLQVIGQQVEDPQAAATLWMSGIDFIQGNLVQRVANVLDFDFHHSVL
ncbi:EAL domain-containing protein [Luteimonas sp. 3794]|uniref:EAL domain-containing protein n=1 Tax=Luteimonas sp. 3794 TaxID=2817730 RepID=UPI00285DF09D|nr:EAL domain-containing protein [Luteimonas sp. 3794]MDR6991748.1 EAL domain-containing protein (putative c-di-GMP-specific phosphodiesterase class I)/CheY-like chemotaxis protein [Luteimonas sp. 3794]